MVLRWRLTGRDMPWPIIFVTPDLRHSAFFLQSGDADAPLVRRRLPSRSGCKTQARSRLQPRGRRRLRSWCIRYLDQSDVASSTPACSLSQRAGQLDRNPADTRDWVRRFIECRRRGMPEVTLLIHLRRRGNGRHARSAAPDKAKKIFSGFSPIGRELVSGGKCAGLHRPISRNVSGMQRTCAL